MYISIDLGGTKTRIALSKNLHVLDSVEKFPSFKSISDQQNKLKEIITPIINNTKVKAVSIGIPGTYDLHQKRFLKVPNYKILEGQSFSFFSDLFAPDTKIFVHNDAALACLGEAVHGAGKQYRSVAYLTLSTGVGGALIAHKRIPDAIRMFEPGHHIIKLDDSKADTAGIAGSMESFLSGTSFKQRYGVSAEECVDKDTWENYGNILGACLVNVNVFWSPDVIVLGGSLSNKYDLFISATNNYLNKIGGVNIAPIKKTQLEDDAGLIGGFECINQKAL